LSKEKQLQIDLADLESGLELIEEEKSEDPPAERNSNVEEEVSGSDLDEIMSRSSMLFFNTIEHYFNLEYLSTCFTVVYGTTLMILVVVLCSDLDPKIIPFRILPIQFNHMPNLTAQLSMMFTFFSFVTTNVLFMRVVLVLSFGIAIISNSLCPPPLNFSFMVWQFAILLINSKHVLIICYGKRHISFDVDREAIYDKMFSTLLSRHEFQRLTEGSLIRTVNSGRFYANINDSCSNLTILIGGKLEKTDKAGKSTLVEECTFVDSPEFIMRESEVGQLFNISFFAKTDCRIMIWPREVMNKLLERNSDLNGPLLASLGIDVSKKVFVSDVAG
jgi:hypothetical protein